MDCILLVRKGFDNMAVLTFTARNFEQEALKADRPVLVDFWADWCAPCKMFAPVLDQIAAETTAVKIGKINIDDEPGLAQQFNVMSIPTLLLIKDGKVQQTAVGVQSKDFVLNMIKK